MIIINMKRLSGITPGSLRCMVEYLGGLLEWNERWQSLSADGLDLVDDFLTSLLRNPDLGSGFYHQLTRWIAFIEERSRMLTIRSGRRISDVVSRCKAPYS